MPAPDNPPPRKQTKEEISVGQGGCVPWHPDHNTITVVVKAVLQCIPCFYECRCMSDGVFIQFVCQVFNLIMIQIKICQRFVCSLCR